MTHIPRDIGLLNVQILTSYIQEVESYRLTDRQTDNRNYMPRHFAGGQLPNVDKCIQQLRQQFIDEQLFSEHTVVNTPRR